MAKKFEIEVEKLNGYCASGYKKGDIITCEGLNTPDNGYVIFKLTLIKEDRF